MEKPAAGAADNADNPEGHHRQHDIPQSTVDPSIEHHIERCVFHGVKVCLYDFPEEVTEEGKEREADFRYPRKA